MRLICFLFTSMTLLTIATQPHDFLPMITVIYRTTSSPADHDLLQRDLDNLESWATTWQMSFNATKCKLLSITNKKKPSKFACSLGSETLSPADEHDYLGVRCRRDLRWSSNCTKICNKANKRLGLLRRTLTMTNQSKSKRTCQWCDHLSSMQHLHGVHIPTGLSPNWNRFRRMLPASWQTITTHTATRLALYHR